MSGIVYHNIHDEKELRFELFKRIVSNTLRVENLPSYFEEVCGDASNVTHAFLETGNSVTLFVLFQPHFIDFLVDHAKLTTGSLVVKNYNKADNSCNVQVMPK